jgi:hypothetical protein
MLLLYFCNQISKQLMKIKSLYILLFCVLFFSCKNNDQTQIIDQQKEIKKAEVIFNNINKAWVFNVADMESPSTNWIEWRSFITEINQKPKSSIGAFQKKTKTLSKKVDDLNLKIPYKYNLPQIKARIMVLSTKIKAMDLFIHLNQIPDKKVISLITDVNTEIQSLQMQMQEIVRREQIPAEVGEPDRIRMKDTSRAVGNNMIIKE